MTGIIGIIFLFCDIIKLIILGGILKKNKAIKIFLLVFVLVNLAGGSFIGIREYLQDKEYQNAYNQYNHMMVKGAYDSKETQRASYAEELFIAAFAVGLGGLTYSVLVRRRIRKRQSFKTPKKPLKFK